MLSSYNQFRERAFKAGGGIGVDAERVQNRLAGFHGSGVVLAPDVPIPAADSKPGNGAVEKLVEGRQTSSLALRVRG